MSKNEIITLINNRIHELKFQSSFKNLYPTLTRNGTIKLNLPSMS